MLGNRVSFLASILLFFLLSCGPDKPKRENSSITPTEQPNTATIKDSLMVKEAIVEEVKEEKFVLNDENAIDFFFQYAKEVKEDKVKITTSLGSFTVELFDNVPYHKANFIYLAKKGYFENTMFHRVVKDFIIQGGNSDRKDTGKKRGEIGRYLLPPDAKKGYKHHRGVISMPSSERDNPYKLASPYEFFVVVTKPGSYHLDGEYTPFGRVIEGMDIVDKINQTPVDDGDWPMVNVFILKAEAF